MTTPTDQLYDLKGEPPRPPREIVVGMSQIKITPKTLTPSAARRLHRFAKILIWLMVAIFLYSGATWAFHAGMDQRREIWQGTRSIRFKDDICRGFDFGNTVLRFAEQQAKLQPKADALADQSPKILARANLSSAVKPLSPTFRRLTPAELTHGIVAYMDDVATRPPNFDDLDYTPLRLAIMTLWTRHVQRLRPDMDSYPHDRVEDTMLTQDEDVAEPLMQLNAYCAAASSVAIFFLVLVWVNKSFRPARPFVLERWWRKYRGLPRQVLAQPNRNPRWAWTVPHGIFAFMLATAGFWYAYATLVHFPARPAPAISVVQIQPAADGTATVVANINSQNQDTNWHVDFGNSIRYGHTSGAQSADNSLQDQQLAVKLQPIAPGQTVHFRVVATSAGGTIATPDYSFINAGNNINVFSDPIGGINWPTWTVWLRLLALFIIMIVAAQMLPPIHRGWACGAVAAMLLWFDPLILIDSHAWPQWDIWIIPLIITSALIASINWWTVAGILFGVACMLKGQMLLGGPILILWPFLEGRFGALWRVIVGFLFGCELTTWPWLVNTPQSLKWVEMAMLGALVVLAISWLRTPMMHAARHWIINPLVGSSPAPGTPGEGRGGGLAIPRENFREDPSPINSILLASAILVTLVIATWIILFPIARHQAALPPFTLLLFLLIIVIPPFFLRRKKLPYWLIGVFALAVLIASIAFNGSYSWEQIGWAYGSVRHDQIQMSRNNLSNLTSILSQSYGWDIHDPLGTLHLNLKTPGPWRLGPFAIPMVDRTWSIDFDVKSAMALLYGVCLFIASAAAALHHRRNDRRFLVALVAPWIIFPIVMCQMGDRYTVWACALSCAMVAVSLELSLLHLLLTVVSFAMVTRQLVNFESSRWPQLFQFTTPWFPGMGWLMTLIAAIFLFASLIPSRKCLTE